MVDNFKKSDGRGHRYSRAQDWQEGPGPRRKDAQPPTSVALAEEMMDPLEKLWGHHGLEPTVSPHGAHEWPQLLIIFAESLIAAIKPYPDIIAADLSKIAPKTLLQISFWGIQTQAVLFMGSGKMFLRPRSRIWNIMGCRYQEEGVDLLC